MLVACAAGLCAVVVAAPSVLAGTASETFKFGENGTWVVPDRVTSIEVEVAGGGGGGGNNADVSGGSGALVKSSVTTQGGEVLDIGVGGGGAGLTGTATGGAGGGGASIVSSTSTGLSDLLIIAGGGGGAGIGADSARSSSGGSAGINAAGDGGDAGSFSGLDAGQGGKNGIGGSNPGNATSPGQNYVLGTTAANNGAGGVNGSGLLPARVGGAGSEARTFAGGRGGAGFGGGSTGANATVSDATANSGGGGGGSTAQGQAVNLVPGETSYYSSAGGTGGVLSAGGHGWVVITWVIPAPLPDPELPAGAAQREPVVLQLTMPAGVQCSTLQVDSTGPWVRLPAADDCSIEVNARSGSADDEPGLLGWATTPNFPVKLAQRQIDNGWGAYETFDSSGDLTAVFIPAGGWAQASSDTNLFPIWAE
jgi:hypothetical protein